MTDQEKNKITPTQLWWQQPLMLFGELSAWVGFPVIIAVFLGQYLDNKYNTKPWLFLVTVGVAFAISTFGIISKAMKMIKTIEKSELKSKENKDKL